MAEGLKSSLEVKFSAPPSGAPKSVLSKSQCHSPKVGFFCWETKPTMSFSLRSGCPANISFQRSCKRVFIPYRLQAGNSSCRFLCWIRLASKARLAYEAAEETFPRSPRPPALNEASCSLSISQTNRLCNGYSKYLFIPGLPGCEGSQKLGLLLAKALYHSLIQGIFGMKATSSFFSLSLSLWSSTVKMRNLPCILQNRLRRNARQTNGTESQ